MKNYTAAMRLAFSYISRYPTYWFWFIIRLLYVALDLITTVILGKIIDLLSNPDFDPKQVWLFAGTYIGLLIISPGLEIITASRSLWFANNIARDFRKDAIALLENAPIDFFKEKNRGAFLKIIDGAHWSLYRISEDIIHRYVTSVGSVIGIFLSAVIFKPFIIIVFIASSILSLINLVIFSKKEKRASVAFSRQEEAFTGGLAEFLNNFKTVFYLNLFKKQETDLRIKIDNAFKQRLEVVRCSLRKWYNHGQLQQVTTVAVFVFCLINVMHGNFSIGTLVVILAFSSRLSGQMGTLLGYSEDYVDRAASIERYHDELLMPLKEKASAKSGLIDGTFLALSASVIKLRRDERENLSDVSFIIRESEKIAVVGHTGGGKSTLLDVILKAATDYEGVLTINDLDYRTLNGRDIVDIFSIVPQDVQLFRGTIRENIGSSERAPTDSELEDLLSICGLSSFIERLPQKADEPVLEGAANISGGERQRIGIARALFQNHPFLILDEATASLDPKTEQEVIGNIMREYPQLTLMYVTHKYSLLEKFDKIFVIDNGRIIENGSFEELRNNGCLFKELYEASRG